LLLAGAFIFLELLPARRLLLVALAQPGPTPQSDADKTPFLVRGQPAKRELSSGETFSYYISLESGQYLQLVVEQQSVDASVTLFGPDDRVLTRIDCRQFGPTPLSLISESDGRYRLQIDAPERAHTHGWYDLQVAEIRSSKPQDKQRILAEQTFTEAETLRKDWTAESNRQAIDKLKGSLRLWQEIGDLREEVRTLRRIGDFYLPFSDYQNALTFYLQVLSLSKRIRDPWEECEALNQISGIYMTLGDNQKAFAACSRAEEIAQRTGNRRGQATALNNIGEVHNWAGNLQRALDFYRQALVIWKAIGDNRGLGQTYTYFGYTYSDLGQTSESSDAYDRAMQFWQAADDQYGRARTLSALGRFYSRIGERQKALDFFFQAMQLSQRLGDPIEEGRTCSGIAYVYNDLGQPRRALEYYDRALSLFRLANYRNAEAGILNDYAGVHFSLGEYQEALKYLQQSVSIFRSTGNHRMEIVGLRDIGRVFAAQGDDTEALKAYFRARSFYHSEQGFRGEAITLNLIGDVYQEQRELQKAHTYYAEALPLFRRAEYRLGEAATLYNLASIERSRLNFNAARAPIEAALNLVEALRGKVTSQELRSSYFASVRQHYELYIDVLMKLHQQEPAAGLNEAAFDVSEKARARSLVESLNEARADIKQGVEGTLLDRERSLEQQLDAKAQRRQVLLGEKKKDEADAVSEEIDQLTARYDELLAQIKSQSPRYAALTQPHSLNVKEVQEQLLDDDSILLEYMLGDERSYLWAVTRGDVYSFELPARAQIEKAAGDFHASLIANQPLANETFEERQTRVAQANARITAEAATLSRMVLGPVADKFGSKRILIIPDGALQYIPFQALPVPTADALLTTAEPVPLLLNHEIVYEPSATTLALVLRENRGHRRVAGSVAVFANPVFESDDQRVRSENSVALADARRGDQYKEQLKEVFRDVGLGDGGRIPPLPASREEADAIISVLPWRSALKAVDFEASRATVDGTNLGRYRVVHFATHGVVDYQHPELSGLVLSLVDQQGRPQDGYLRVHDIYNLKLPVDLVVLSACNTGLGKDVKGEGLIGLTRGFMYAGAGGVVASLWKVDDDATAELMKHFYEAMFTKGLPAAAALRDAQLIMWQQKRWHAPYYWAAFVLQGQYNQNEMLDPQLRAWEIAALAVLLSTIPAIAFLFFRRRRLLRQKR